MKRTLAVAAAMLVAVPVFLRAQEAPAAPKLAIAVIDVQRIVEESAMGKEAKARLMKAQEDKVAEGRKLNDDLEGLKKQLATQGATLTDAKRSDLQKQIEDKQVQLQRFQDDAQQQLDELKRKELDALEKKIMPLINELGREMKLQFIFNKFQSGLVYADDSTDITDVVLKRFNTTVTK
ncbi:MAG: OmpH family outer membrane protein [Acidobacteriota bacterium]